MIPYLQNLLNNPSEKNLDEVHREIIRISEILLDYHNVLINILSKWNSNIKSEEIERIKRSIKYEEDSISEYKIAEKIISDILRGKENK